MRSFYEVIPQTDDDVVDLVSLEALKLELGITSSSEDASLSARITRESKLIAEQCERVFALTAAVETFDFGQVDPDKPSQTLGLRFFPIRSIEALIVDGADEDGFEFDADSGRVFRTGGCWSGRIEITYMGGYQLPGDAPARLQAACVEAVRARRLSVARDPAIRDISDGDQRVGYFAESVTTGGFNAVVLDLIRPYRRIVVA